MARVRRYRPVVCLSVLLGLCSQDSPAQTYSYTLSSEFDQGTLLNVNHTDYADQLQINVETTTFPFIWVALSSLGTIVKIHTTTGKVYGEYFSSPEGMPRNPSRSTVDRYGSVWAGNRDEGTNGKGTIVKVGLIMGGTRGYPDPKDPRAFIADPTGGYIKDPKYSECSDRNNDGLIRTSVGFSDVLAWPNITDGAGSPCDAANPDAKVVDAEDECIRVFQWVNGANVRHVSLDPDNHVWFGGYSDIEFNLLDNDTGCLLKSRQFSTGGYGGVTGCNGLVWSAHPGNQSLLRYDPVTDQESVLNQPVYGVGLDSRGNVWGTAHATDQVFKVEPLTSSVLFVKPVDPNGLCQGAGECGAGTTACPTGIAVRTLDDTVWIADRYCNYRGQGYDGISRLDANGDIIKVIPLLDEKTGEIGRTPTGVVVDGNGMVWAICYTTGNVMRIDPDGGADGLGAVDMTVSFPESNPYVYSDMSGLIPLTNPAFGFFSVIHETPCGAFRWNQAAWNQETPLPAGAVHEPPGTAITVEVRTSNTIAGLGGKAFRRVGNGVPFGPMDGKYIEVRTNLKVATGAFCGEYATPILTDLAFSGSLPEADPGPDPGLCEGQAVTLNGENAVDMVCEGTIEYRWSWPGNPGAWSPDPVVTDTPATTTTYSLEMRCSSQPDCLYQGEITATVLGKAPDAVAGPDAGICLGETVILSGTQSTAPECTGSLEYRWSWPGNPGAWSASPDLSDTPTGSTTYLLEVRCTDAPGCVDTDETFVLVNEYPVAEAGPAVTACQGEQVVLDASGSIQPTCASGLSYRYSVLGGPVVRNWSADPRYGFTASVVETRTFLVEVYCNDAPTCVSSDQIEVVVEDCSTPVRFAWYRAMLTEDGLLVRWQTLSEEDTLGFVVKRFTGPNDSTGTVVSGGMVPSHGPGELYEVTARGRGASVVDGLAVQIEEITASGPGDKTPLFPVEPKQSKGVTRAR